MHIPDWDDSFLEKFNSKNYMEMLKLADVDATILYDWLSKKRIDFMMHNIREKIKKESIQLTLQVLSGLMF
ncbi:MAG: hypothetical protein GYA02_16600 [Clostridiaceae bacterium]|jgi:hypothetical protein|nr:hypothetical protein [Clostridiaceae bacterium]